jgi:cellulose synthase/poly-beta-1,6-N-acetylglucosamine synthase-like glycosyltransferase
MSWANRHAGKLLLLGLAGVAAYNWRQWQRDKALLAARAQPTPLPDWETWPKRPKVSMLVAAWNEADLIEEHIRSFLGLCYLNKEMILCAGGSDGTYDLARRRAGERLKVLEQYPGEGKQGALQRCLEQAGGEIVFLTDADCLLDDESFFRTIAPIVQEGEDVTSGMSRPLDRQLGNPYVVHQWCTDTYAAEKQPMYIGGLKGANCALRRAALEAVGGFRAPVRTGTDYHLAKRLLAHGYRIRRVGESVNRTEYSETFSSYVRRQSRWLRNLMVHGTQFAVRQEVWAALRTPFVGLAMLFFPLTFLALGAAAAVGWGLLLVHSLAAKVRYFAFTQVRHQVTLSKRYLLWMPVYTFSDFAAWSLTLLDLIGRKDVW